MGWEGTIWQLIWKDDEDMPEEIITSCHGILYKINQELCPFWGLYLGTFHMWPEGLQLMWSQGYEQFDGTKIVEHVPNVFKGSRIM